MAQLDAPVRFVWTTNGRVRRVDEPLTPERLEAIARLLRAASEAFNHRDTENTENDTENGNGRRLTATRP